MFPWHRDELTSLYGEEEEEGEGKGKEETGRPCIRTIYRLPTCGQHMSNLDTYVCILLRMVNSDYTSVMYMFMLW